MSLVPSFSVSNNTPTTSSFTVTDTSTGSDGAIANRLIYLYLSDNSLFTGSAVQFPLSAGSSITPNILDKDYAVNIVLNWVDGSGNVLYTSSQLFVFTGYLEWFFYSLTQTAAAQPSLLSDTNWFGSWSKLRTLIDSANQAITIGSSIFNAQNMILLAQYIQTNQQFAF